MYTKLFSMPNLQINCQGCYNLQFELTYTRQVVILQQKQHTDIQLPTWNTPVWYSSLKYKFETMEVDGNKFNSTIKYFKRKFRGRNFLVMWVIAAPEIDILRNVLIWMPEWSFISLLQAHLKYQFIIVCLILIRSFISFNYSDTCISASLFLIIINIV